VRPKSRARRWLLVLALAVIAVVFHSQILGALGAYLVRTDPPRKADAVLVLAGDGWGHRILTAAQLVRDGYAPKVLVSGPDGSYGLHESDLAIPFAVKHGYPESYFVAAVHSGRSTRAEALALLPEIHREGIRRMRQALRARAKAARAAAKVASSSAFPCADETNPASKADGAR